MIFCKEKINGCESCTYSAMTKEDCPVIWCTACAVTDMLTDVDMIKLIHSRTGQSVVDIIKLLHVQCTGNDVLVKCERACTLMISLW